MVINMDVSILPHARPSPNQRQANNVGTVQRLRQLGPDIQWIESFVASDKTFCVYLALDEAIIHRHADMSGFPATKITEIRRMIDPTTASA